MNISSVKFNNTKFKGYKDDGIIGFDDSVSAARRNYIREHYDSWHMPYQSIYENSYRLSDYQLGTMIHGLEKYHEIQRVGDTSIYRGQTLVSKPKSLRKISKMGVKTVIDLVGYGKGYEDAVKNAGMDYYVYNIYENWWNAADITHKHVERLVDFLDKMQKGNIYIGCQHGANDTDIALILNDFFNPMLEGKVCTKITPKDSDFPIKLNTLYDMISKEQKKRLGWTKEFEQRLIKKLISI